MRGEFYMNYVKAILFDSGRTLNVPRTVHRFITPNFKKIIDREDFIYSNEEMNKAMRVAYEHISKILLVETE